jgi:hypothetical protein
MRKISTKLYQYAELSDRAKEKARQWWLDCRDSSDFDFVLDDFADVAALLGISLGSYKVRTVGGKEYDKPALYWSLAYCQDDGAGFEGSYSYKADAPEAIREHAPKDERLHRIADRLHALQAQHGNTLEARITTGRSVYVSVELTSPDDGDHSTDAEKELRAHMRDLGDWLYEQLRAGDEYQCSEDQIAEAMESNGYEFTEDGAWY